MPNSKQSNPSDAADAHFMPTWNSQYGTAPAFPAARAVTESEGFSDMYSRNKAGENRRRRGSVPTATIGTLTPATGPAAGGTTVTLNGTDLFSTTGVTVGGNAVTELKVVSNTKITFKTAAHAAGAVNVVVTTGAGSVTKNNGFTYTA